MKTALIATYYNEIERLDEWLDALVGQSVGADELSICDGGSNDGSWEKLNDWRERLEAKFGRVILLKERCNIARGRNLAIAETEAELIASSDAGSLPDSRWLEEMLRPLRDDRETQVVGGLNVPMIRNDFHRFLETFEGSSGDVKEPPLPLMPSSRCIAFRRSAFDAVGGYPEWLTLTAEDALFNMNLHAIGMKFTYAPDAIVNWSIRDTEEEYFKMLAGYGYGSAEARIHWSYFRRRILTTFVPPLLLLSRHSPRHLPFRYRRNAASATGYLRGLIQGRRAPSGWKKADGVYLSPETQVSIASMETAARPTHEGDRGRA